MNLEEVARLVELGFFSAMESALKRSRDAGVEPTALCMNRALCSLVVVNENPKKEPPRIPTRDDLLSVGPTSLALLLREAPKVMGLPVVEDPELGDGEVGTLPDLGQVQAKRARQLAQEAEDAELLTPDELAEAKAQAALVR